MCVYVYIYMSQAQKWVRKETTRFRTFVINGYLAWTPAGAQTNHGSSSAHAQCFSHQNGGADIRDIIK